MAIAVHTMDDLVALGYAYFRLAEIGFSVFGALSDEMRWWVYAVNVFPTPGAGQNW